MSHFSYFTSETLQGTQGTIGANFFPRCKLSSELFSTLKYNLSQPDTSIPNRAVNKTEVSAL